MRKPHKPSDYPDLNRTWDELTEAEEAILLQRIQEEVLRYGVIGVRAA